MAWTKLSTKTGPGRSGWGCSTRNKFYSEPSRNPMWCRCWLSHPCWKMWFCQLGLFPNECENKMDALNQAVSFRWWPLITWESSAASSTSPSDGRHPEQWLKITLSSIMFNRSVEFNVYGFQKYGGCHVEVSEVMGVPLVIIYIFVWDFLLQTNQRAWG